jgi:small GTP-binding protein
MKENIDNNEDENSQENQPSQKSDTESDGQIIISKDDNEEKRRNIEIIPETSSKTDLSFKVIIIGDSNVGKSSLANKAVKNTFDTSYNTTLGFEYFSFFVKIDKKTLKLQIWDTCGQEVYQSLIANFYRNSSLAIMVYGINNRDSFEHIDNWLKEIKRSSNPDAKIILIGNKSDLENERKVTYEEAEKYAEELEFSKFYETSAKNGINTQEVFLEAANILYNDYLEYNSMTHSSASDSQKEGQKLINNNQRDASQSKSFCC